MKTHSIRLEGFVPTKKNGKMAWRGRVVIDPKKKAQIAWLELQARKAWGRRPPLKRVGIRVRFHVAHHRADMDGKYTTVQDILEKAGVIVNDNTLHVVHHSCWAFKTGRDECLVTIREMAE